MDIGFLDDTFHIERDVYHWLRSQGARFEEKKHLFEVGSLRLDFLVLEPHPMVIQCVSLNRYMAGPNVRHEFITLRIAIAERFGPHVPVIAVTLDRHPMSRINPDDVIGAPPLESFFDAVLRAEDLPTVESIRTMLVPSPLLRQVIRPQLDRDIELTSETELARKWTHAVPLMELVEGGPFSPGTLAAATESHFAELRPAFAEFRQNPPRRGFPALYEALDRFIGPHPSVIPKRCLGAVLSNIGGFRHGGHWDIGTLDHILRSVVPVFRSDVWQGPTGENFLIRSVLCEGATTIGETLLDLKAQAWMFRAAVGESLHSTIMLLGLVESRLPDIRLIHSLEASGWTVLPWDLAQESPLVVQFIQEGRI